MIASDGRVISLFDKCQLFNDVYHPILAIERSASLCTGSKVI